MKYFVLILSTLAGVVLPSCSSDNYVRISVKCNVNDNVIVEYLCKDNIPIYKRITTPSNKDNTKFERIKISNNIDDYRWVSDLKYIHSTAQDDSRFYEDPYYYKGTVRDFGFDLFHMNSLYYGLLDTLLMWGDVCIRMTDSTIVYDDIHKIIENTVLSSYGLNNRRINDVSIKIKNRLIKEFVVGSDKDTTYFVLKYSKDTLKDVSINKHFTKEGNPIQTLNRISYEYRVVKIKDLDLVSD